MKNSICIIFISLICIVLLVGCGGKKTKQKTEVKNDMTLSQEEKVNVGKYLFNADEMESIEISGKDLEFGYGEEENPQLIKSINGGCKAYLNDEGKICVIDEKNHKENIEIGKNRRTETREETSISKLYDWKQAEIKNIGDGSNFGAEFVVQNEKYIFFLRMGIRWFVWTKTIKM